MIQAAISFVFGGLGAFVACRLSMEQEKRKETREQGSVKAVKRRLGLKREYVIMALAMALIVWICR